MMQKDEGTNLVLFRLPSSDRVLVEPLFFESQDLTSSTRSSTSESVSVSSPLRWGGKNRLVCEKHLKWQKYSSEQVILSSLSTKMFQSGEIIPLVFKYEQTSFNNFPNEINPLSAY